MNSSSSFIFDVFISYSESDHEWVEDTLVPRLKHEGFRVASEDEFTIGEQRLKDSERLIQTSQRVIVVLSPDWLADEWNELESVLARSLDPAAKRRKLMPLMLKACDVPDTIAMLRLSIADFTSEKYTEREFRRLIRDIRDSLPVPLPLQMGRGLGSLHDWHKWIRRYRQRVALGGAGTLLLISVILMALQWPPFQPRLGWKAIGAVGAKGAWRLHRAGGVLLASTTTKFRDCTPNDTGLWRSTDDGQTWVRIKVPLARPNKECELDRIEAFAHVPMSPTIIYAATNDTGLWRSDEAGADDTWHRVAPTAPISELQSVAVSGTNPDVVFVTVRRHAGSTAGGLYRITNGGANWQSVEQQDVCSGESGAPLPVGLNVQIVLAAGRYVFAATHTDKNGVVPLPGYGLYVSEDDGRCWHMIDDAKGHFDYEALAVVPDAPDVVLTLVSDLAPTSGVDDRSLWMVRVSGGRDTAPLFPFGDSRPLAIYVQPRMPSTPSRWYVMSTVGNIWRGTISGSGTVEQLPLMMYCPLAILSWLDARQHDDACFGAMAPASIASDEPLILARDRLYTLAMVPWQFMLLPDSPKTN